MSRVPRGIRNHNPGNLDRVPGTTWRGQAALQSDPRFVVFTSPVWGIRAMARVLRVYYRLRELRTVRKIINRWAPPTENRTHAYALAVAARLGVALDQELVLEDRTLIGLCAAITKHENGYDPYPEALYADGVALSGR